MTAHQKNETTFTPSAYQAALYDAVERGTKSIVVNAVAGSGKTTTILNLVNCISPSQSIVYVAFGADMVSDTRERVQAKNVTVTTVHAAGRKVLAKHIKLTGQPTIHKYTRIAQAVWENKFPKEKQRNVYCKARGVADLVDLVQLTLTPVHDRAAVMNLIDRYAIENVTSDSVKILPLVLGMGLQHAERRGDINFTDMIYLPIAKKLTFPTFDVVLADEIQDFNACQAEVVLAMRKEGGQFVGVGDPHQSIMAFAGADAHSFENLKNSISATEMLLSVCYRCPTSHIALAKQTVPHIQPRPNAPAGQVIWDDAHHLQKFAEDGALVLSRKTAPLLKSCIDLISRGRKATVRGRDILTSLTTVVEQVADLDNFTFQHFEKHLVRYAERKTAELKETYTYPDKHIDALMDRCAAVRACYQRWQGTCHSANALISAISYLFESSAVGVEFSTIHRAKGRQARTVIILNADELPYRRNSMQEWEKEQEDHLHYVALTRSMERLVLLRAEERR